MRDHYSPTNRRGGTQYDRDEQYGSSYERRDRYDRDNRDRRYSRSPPRDRPAGDRYYDRPTNGEFNIRGTADRIRFRLPRAAEHFTFRAPGPPAPLFPSPEPPSGPARPQVRRTEGAGRGEDNRGQRGSRRDRKQAGRQRGGFGPRGANTRDILRRDRGSTPEQLLGMSTEGQTRFMTMESSDEEESDDEHIIDLTQDSGEEDNDQAPRKRVKIESPAPDTEAALPKWSNPDPYTALPPPDFLGAPKKDVVKLIRKAKIESGPNTDSASGVKDNIDFISFNDVSEEGELSDGDSTRAASPPRYAPKGPSTMRRRHPENGKQVSYSTAAQNSRSMGRTLDDEVGSPPSPPEGLVMPTDEELVTQYAGGPKGRKRKREQQSKGLGDILPEWETDGSNATPWCTDDHSRTAKVGLRFHKEICDFYEFVRPYRYEEAVRRDLVDRVQQAVRSHGGKDIEVRCFGSFASGLYLPTADMDLVAVSSQYMRAGRKTIFQRPHLMHKLGAFLLNSGIAAPETMSVVAHAKVPIVKFIDKKTGIKVDISFENDTGLVANNTFQEWKEKYPAMPPLVLLIKQLIAMRGLNEVFTGGLGGFSIMCLVVSMMQLMPEIQSGNMDPQQHYGDLLLNFLDLYGNKFNIVRTGITMDTPGYFDKLHNPAKKQNPNNLTIIDPNNPDNDISGGSRNINQVLGCFRSAHAAIQRRLAQIDSGKDVEGSILECVLGGNYSSFMRQRNKLSMIHRGHEVSPPPVPPSKQRKPDKPPGALPLRGKKNQPGPPRQENYKSVAPPAQLQRNKQNKHPDVQLMQPQQNASPKPKQNEPLGVQPSQSQDDKLAKVSAVAAGIENRLRKRGPLTTLPPIDAAPFRDTIEINHFPQNVRWARS